MFTRGIIVLLLIAVAYVGAESKKKVEHKIIQQQGCQEKSLCCQGKNNTCRVFGKRLNNKDSKTCFCDSTCKDLRDCCEDYEDTCPPVDCKLADWGPYGECSTRCGWGIKERSKRVLQEPLNGGAPCGKQKEKLVCYAYKCKVARAPEAGLAELQETGKIIPATYGPWRKNKLYDPFKDIRSNLFHHYSANSIISRPAYCAKYEITAARKSCQSPFFAEWAPKLKEGSTVCVECQQLAMHRKLGVRCRGHGVYMRETRWNAVTIPGCHGEWKMITRQEDCTCSDDKDSAFILL